MRLDVETPNTSWALTVDNVERWAFIDSLFSKEECEQIIKLGLNRELKRATVGSNAEKKSILQPSIRKSQVVFLSPSDDMTWVYRRLSDAVRQLNDKYFNFDLWGFAEGLQFTEYKAPDGDYKEHIDKSYNSIVRKLSIVIQLSDPETYAGGDFEIIDSVDAEKIPRKQGTLFAFPSYTLHRVTPVTAGTRYSLVGWVTGKPFK